MKDLRRPSLIPDIGDLLPAELLLEMKKGISMHNNLFKTVLPSIVRSQHLNCDASVFGDRDYLLQYSARNKKAFKNHASNWCAPCSFTQKCLIRQIFNYFGQKNCNLSKFIIHRMIKLLILVAAYTEQAPSEWFKYGITIDYCSPLQDYRIEPESYLRC